MDKVNTIIAKEKGREDSFWYSGLIATMGKYRLYAEGDICVEFPDGNYEKDYRAVEHAEEIDFDDSDLHKLDWINNNWFEVGWVDYKGNIEFDLGVVEYNYDDAIEMLKQYYKGEIK